MLLSASSSSLRCALSSRSWPVFFSVFCFHCSTSNFSRPHCGYCSALPDFFFRYYGLCLPSTDSIDLSRPGSRFFFRFIGRSPRVRPRTFVSYTCYIYASRVSIASGFVLFCRLTLSENASYAVSVRQAETLPRASFRFHLTMDTLAFG